MHVFNINLQKGMGGGEVYTSFLMRSLLRNGANTTLIATTNASWDILARGIPRISVSTLGDLSAALEKQPPALLIFHTIADADSVAKLRQQGHFVTCFAHMPLYGRNPAALRPYDAIFPVSNHVRDSAIAAGLAQTYALPIYGIADLSVRPGNGLVAAHSPYDWDRRKFRERIMGIFEPVIAPFRRAIPYKKGDGIALGIVSRLTTIKQFPEMFRHLTPILLRHPAFRVEIFGAGGYASVRDLRRSLAPLRNRVRFWGHQSDVRSVYSGIDYLLTGLPEKEALGLNVIEAQACGCPILAVNAPPFTETVASEISGLLYRDPRQDNGEEFDKLLTRLEEKQFEMDSAKLAEHLQAFGEAAFDKRVYDLVNWAQSRLEQMRS